MFQSYAKDWQLRLRQRGAENKGTWIMYYYVNMSWLMCYWKGTWIYIGQRKRKESWKFGHYPIWCPWILPLMSVCVCNSAYTYVTAHTGSVIGWPPKELFSDANKGTNLSWLATTPITLICFNFSNKPTKSKYGLL